VAYQRQQAEGLMNLEELRAHLGELDERRTDAESELATLRDSGRRLDELRAYSDLIDEHLRELPLHRRAGGTREGGPRGRRLPIFPLSPEMFRERTPEEKEELRLAEERERAERYRDVYTSLGLSVTAYKDGTLELTWRAGKGVSEVCASPRCTASATTS
jgi:hypothetical protein